MRSPRPALLALVGSLSATACARPPAGETELTHYEYRPAESAPYTPVEGARSQPVDPKSRASVRVRLPAVAAEDPAVYVPRSFGLREVRLDDRLLFRDGRDSWTVLPLPPDHAGRELRLDYLARDGALFTRPVRVGSFREILRRRFLLDLSELAVGAALLIVGLFAGVAGLRRRAAAGYRELGAVATTLGILTIAQTDQVMNLLHPSAMVRAYVADAMFFVFPATFALFIRALFGDTARRMLRWAALATVGVAAAGLLADRTGLAAWGQFYPLTYALFAGILGASFTVLRRGLRGGDPVARTVFAGVITMTVIAIPDIAWGLGLFYLGFQTSHWAALALIASLTMALERRFVAQSAELEDRVQSLSERNREIDTLNQELRHQIAARSRQLSAALSEAPPPLAARLAVREGMTFEGRYRILRELGAGGMGTVHEVARITDGRSLALKVMSGDVGPHSAARFVREAEIAAKFAHPNLVAVLDVGLDASGAPFLVMEKVNGPSLESERARFGDVRWAIPLLRDVACALVELHEHGVVHRDLKPANVLLDLDAAGRATAKVSDFGISHLADPDPGSADTLPLGATPAHLANRGLTRTGVVLGTPAYMAPELAEGARAASPASDIHAFGLMAWEMLARSPAFPVPALFLALSGREIMVPSVEDLRAANSEAPRGLAEIVARALALDPKARPSAAELLAALG